MAFDSWGPQSLGTRIAEQDSIANFVNLARGQQLQALAQQEQTKATQMQQEMHVMSQLATEDGTGGPAAGGSISDLFYDKARKAASLGALKLAGDIGLKGSQVAEHEQNARTSKALEKRRQLERQMELVDYADNTFGRATDTASWQRAQMQFESNFPDERNPFEGIHGYDPDLVNHIRATTLKEKDRLGLEIDREKVEVLREAEKRKQSYTDYMKDYRNRMAGAAETRADAIAKRYGSVDARGAKTKPPGQPSNSEIELAREEINLSLGGKFDSTISDIAAAQVASAARRILRDTPGIDAAVARQRAIAQAQQDGLLIKEKNTFSADTIRFAPGKHAATALPWPAEGAKGKFVAGTYYDTPKYGPLKYTGNGQFEQNESSAPPAPPRPGPLDEDEEE